MIHSLYRPEHNEMHNQFKRSLENDKYFEFEEKMIFNKNLDDTSIKYFGPDLNNFNIESSNNNHTANDQNIPTNEEEQNLKRQGLLFLEKISETQNDNEDESLILISSTNKFQLMQPITSAIEIELNISSQLQEKDETISNEISSSDHINYNSEENYDKLTKKRSIKSLKDLDKEEDGLDVIKKIKLS